MIRVAMMVIITLCDDKRNFFYDDDCILCDDGQLQAQVFDTYKASDGLDNIDTSTLQESTTI